MMSAGADGTMPLPGRRTVAVIDTRLARCLSPHVFPKRCWPTGASSSSTSPAQYVEEGTPIPPIIDESRVVEAVRLLPRLEELVNDQLVPVHGTSGPRAAGSHAVTVADASTTWRAHGSRHQGLTVTVNMRVTRMLSPADARLESSPPSSTVTVMTTDPLRSGAGVKRMEPLLIGDV